MKNKFILLFCMILVSFTFVSAIPTLIYTCEDLQNMNNDLSKGYALNNDIDCSDTINWNEGLGFDPIGNETNPFSSYFLGHGHTIYNLYINRQDENYVGLFGLSYTGSSVRISDTNLINAIIIGNSAGEDPNYIGGIIGMLAETETSECYLNNCSFNGIVQGGNGVGGLVGNLEECVINDSSFDGIVVGKEYVGGIVGINTVSTIVNTNSLADVYYLGEYYGGIYGFEEAGTFENNNFLGNLICGIYDTTPPTFTTIPDDLIINYGELFEGVDFVDFDAVDEDYVYFSVNDTENFEIEPNTGQLGNITLLDVGFYPVNVTITDPTGNLDWTIWSLTVLPLEEPPVQGGGSGLAQTFTSTPTTQTTENAPLFSAIGLNLNISSWNLSEKIQSISISEKITEFFQKIKDWFNIQLNLNWRTQ
jgi:hypothetical protein